jgi:hypothetical protein
MCFLFARKFSPSTLEPLLELAPTVLGFGWWLDVCLKRCCL